MQAIQIKWTVKPGVVCMVWIVMIESVNAKLNLRYCPTQIVFYLDDRT